MLYSINSPFSCGQHTSISIYFEAVFQHHSTNNQTRFYLNLYYCTLVMKQPYIMTFQVSFGISMFFTGLALMNVGVKSSIGVRASIHNGFWAWKGAVLSLLCVTTFVIPVPHLDRYNRHVTCHLLRCYQVLQ